MLLRTQGDISCRFAFYSPLVLGNEGRETELSSTNKPFYIFIFTYVRTHIDRSLSMVCCSSVRWHLGLCVYLISFTLRSHRRDGMRRDLFRYPSHVASALLQETSPFKIPEMYAHVHPTPPSPKCTLLIDHVKK